MQKKKKNPVDVILTVILWCFQRHEQNTELDATFQTKKSERSSVGLLSGPERDPPAALSQPADGRAVGRMEEEVVCGSKRGPQQACCSQGGRAWERQPPNRARTVFRGTNSKKTRLCPSCLRTTQGFQGKKCLRVSRSARNNTETSSSPLWNRGGWRL